MPCVNPTLLFLKLPGISGLAGTLLALFHGQWSMVRLMVQVFKGLQHRKVSKVVTNSDSPLSFRQTSSHENFSKNALVTSMSTSDLCDGLLPQAIVAMLCPTCPVNIH